LALYYLWHKNRGFFNFSVTEKALLTGLLAGYFFHNIFVFDNLVSYMLFATLLAYLSRTGSEGEAHIGGDTEVSADTIYTIFAPTIIVVMCVVLWIGSIRPMISGPALIDAIRPQADGAMGNLESFKKVLDMGFAKPEIREQLMQVALSIQGANVDLKVKKDFVDLARAEFEKQLIEVPNDARYEFFYGVFLNRLRMYDEAVVHLKRAVALSPKKQTIAFELASTYLGAGNYTEALPLLKSTYELDTTYTEARIIYAVGALYAKDTKLAGVLLKDVSPTQIATDDRLLAAYINLEDFDTVVEIWKTRVAQDPKNQQVHLSLAAAYLKAGKRMEAVKEIQVAIDVNPALKQQGEFYINEIKAGRNP
jgi:Tfp pilus assembly protein PilF